MHSHQIVLNIGSKQDEKMLTQNDFNETPMIHVDNADLTFYTAQDESGAIIGSAQVNPVDRKVIGALVGNWIAAGFVVSRKTYKEMNKIVREQQKIKDAQVAEVLSPVAEVLSPEQNAQVASVASEILVENSDKTAPVAASITLPAPIAQEPAASATASVAQAAPKIPVPF